MYYFGVYHWRKGLRAAAAVVAAAMLAAVAARLPSRSRLLTAVAAAGFGIAGATGIESLLHPRPWSLNRRRYEALAAELSLDDADSLLDVGCGTGRSLVGLAPAIGDDCTVTGLDRFDDRIILGNGPKLARQNAGKAGLDPELVAGDATGMPLDAGSHEVVTSCMMLHDLPEGTARAALEEMGRVCAPDGRVGLIELPLINDERPVSADFWQELVADAGLEIETVRTLPWPGGEGDYTVVVATPAE
ncbi:class I SAM-dependent methyltransferase [Halolamina salifodinae]|uniref:SAM-dependent methyltransferase n=1 Tax=Halolamina salifodinae TaxID=1202767 RepID=A0A8T4GYE3_9EURY|nr:class I SAM-dependent methyltransferase [Halolamina salifodinae]MBP1987163.1 SAM-dependent methyltransferase [Halolamina salifodinae]